MELVMQAHSDPWGWHIFNENRILEFTWIYLQHGDTWVTLSKNKIE